MGNEGKKIVGFFVKLIRCGDTALSAVYGYLHTSHAKEIFAWLCIGAQLTYMHVTK